MCTTTLDQGHKTVTGSQGIFHSGHVHSTYGSRGSHYLAKWAGLGVVVKIMQVVTGHGRIFWRVTKGNLTVTPVTGSCTHMW